MVIIILFVGNCFIEKACDVLLSNPTNEQQHLQEEGNSKTTTAAENVDRGIKRGGTSRKEPRQVVATSSISSSSSSRALAPAKCRLETKELWHKFHELGTEMIITKSGRLVVAPTLSADASYALRRPYYKDIT